MHRKYTPQIMISEILLVKDYFINRYGKEIKMITEMLAYLVWIVFTISAVAFVFRLLRLDRPRVVRVPVRKDD